MEQKTYCINGKEYKLVERALLKNVANITKLLEGKNLGKLLIPDFVENDLLNKLLKEMLEGYEIQDIYFDDFEDMTGALVDFVQKKIQSSKNTGKDLSYSINKKSEPATE